MKLLTVTCAEDREHFDLLSHSLSQSALAGLPHEVVVQEEDRPVFARYGEASPGFRSSRDVLPESVEARRREARRWQARFGRRGTTMAGSLARALGWPRWVRYTGWHTQQLCKLAVAAASDEDTVVVLDSDVVVTPHASREDFLHRGGAAVCYQNWLEPEQLSRKVLHWQHTAHRLLDMDWSENGPFDCYYDTPFVFHAPAVRAMLSWLEERHQRPWWETLLAQPPRRWSEFGLYRAFLRHHYDHPVDWRETGHIGYIYDASNTDRLLMEFRRLLHEQQCHYITIHSQSHGRHSWGPEDYGERLREELMP